MKTKTFEIGRDIIESSITDLMAEGIKVTKKNILDNINRVLLKHITNNGYMVFYDVDDILYYQYDIAAYDEYNEEHVKLVQSINAKIKKYADKYSK